MHIVVSDREILAVLLYGKLSQQSLFDAQQELMLHPNYSSRNSLWVFDKHFECGFSSIVFGELVNRIKLYCPINTTKKKAAILTASGTHFGMMQLYCNEAEAAGLPFKFKAFREYEEAEEWLMES